MEVTRRQAITAVAGAAVGAAGAVGAGRLAEHLDDDTPLPFYGSPVSAVRPDRSAPSAGSGSVVWGGPGDERRVALTFDDGPHPEWTPRVLAALEAELVPATFFCLGRNVRDHGALHRDSAGRHELGNHTFDHRDLGRLDWSACRDEIARTSRLMEQAYGHPPTLFRPPYGHLGGAALLAAAEAGLTTVMWSAQAREDLVAAHPERIVDDIASQVRPGSIVLAHDTGSEDRLVTIDRLRAIIGRLRDDGYSFVTVSALLRNGSTPATTPATAHAGS